MPLVSRTCNAPYIYPEVEPIRLHGFPQDSEALLCKHEHLKDFLFGQLLQGGLERVDQILRQVPYPKLIAARDRFSDRSIEAVTSIEVVELGADRGYQVEKGKGPKDMRADEIAIAGPDGKETKVSDFDGLRRIAARAIQAGDGTGFHGIREYEGVSLREALAQLGYGPDPAAGFVMSARDGYRVMLSSEEIWQCSACDLCYPRCPKQIHISEVMKAIRNIAIREGYEPPGPFPEVDERICSGCAVCTRACPYEAIERVTKVVDGEERTVAQVTKTLCMKCGICVAACPSGAMNLESISDRELISRMGAGGWLEKPGYLQGGAEEPRILAFVCQWSIHSDREWEKIRGLESDQLRIVNLSCSGRVDPAMILMALTKGADGVLVVGCKEGECHYQRGTYLGRSKVALLEQMLEQLGIAFEEKSRKGEE